MMARGGIEQFPRGEHHGALVGRDDVGAALDCGAHVIDRGLTPLDVEHGGFNHDDRAGRNPGDERLPPCHRMNWAEPLPRSIGRVLSADSPTRARPETRLSRPSGLRRGRGGPVRGHPPVLM